MSTDSAASAATASSGQKMLLLEPIQIGSKTMRNRIAITPHSFWYSAYGRNQSDEKYTGYIERQAAGGAGMVSLQAIWTPPVDGDHPFEYDFLADRLRGIADAAHRHGALVVMQTVHIGANFKSEADPTTPWSGEPLWGFSAVPSDTTLEVAHEMTGAEIESLVEGWGRLAELAVSAGIDGVELHGGHGYLLHQSISPWMNRRTDEWGEPLRFWKAVLKRMRAGMGNDAIIGARVPSDDFRPPEYGGLGRDRLRELTCELVDTGYIDYVNPSEGSSGWHYPRSVGTYHRPHGDFLAGAAAIRADLAGKALVLGVGRITDPRQGEEALQRGDCDFIGMTRAHIADPDLVRKLQSGEAHRIRKCVGANTCIDRIMTGAHVMCFQNPESGREHQVGPLVPATTPRRVLVIGGGPAGLKAAEIAARRGHHVVLAERSARLGGRLASITAATTADELVESVRWVERELEALGVEVRLETEVDSDLLARESYDAIVLATGSRAAGAAFPVDGSLPVLSSDDAMDLVREGKTKRVLVEEGLGNDEAEIVIEQLATAGCQVTVTTKAPMIGAFLGWTHFADFLPRLLALGCRIEERTDIVEIADRQVTTRAQLTGATERRGFDAVVLVQPRVAEDSLAEAASDACDDVRTVGDASAPRNAFAAFMEADTVARRI